MPYLSTNALQRTICGDGEPDGSPQVGHQDLEIRHGAREQVLAIIICQCSCNFLNIKENQPDNCQVVSHRQGGEGDTLVTLEEIDYLRSEPAAPTVPPTTVSSMQGGRPGPIATRSGHAHAGIISPSG